MRKTAYLDCSSGISGDMTLAALVDAGVDLAAIDAAVASLGLHGCRLRASEVRKNGFRAKQIVVEHEHEHAHRHLSQILAIIDGGRLTQRQKDISRKIFVRLAEAEAQVHGCSPEEVHFHEVGAVDSIADIVGTAVGWDLLGVERLVASPIATGSGKIKIAHGEVSVPAPATAELLRGVPLAESSAQGELTTPTGAAIVTTLAESFGPMPAMTVERIGCGAGQRDLPDRPNILRLYVGESAAPIALDGVTIADRVCVMETNLDKTTGETVGYCIGLLWDAGALDVFTTAIQMKKNRPGVKLTVLCRAENAADMEKILFRETATLGIRRYWAERTTLPREPHRVETVWGAVEGKITQFEDVSRFAPEYESCRRIALERQIPLRDVYEAAQKAFEAK